MEHGTTVKLPEVNRKYKDTIFRWLFSDRENLLSLYNAVTGRNYTDANALDIVTLESAVYLGMKNDVAFLVDMRLYLCEHQSTYNPNIPLRNLFYIASEYQVLVKDRSLYSSVLIKLPAPKFLVFYNGPGQVADREELRLSTAYENQQGEPDLELKVTLLNINEGHNKELMEQCRILREYSQYVARVRKYAAQMELNEAVERAVTECIREGILSEFLSRNRAEVMKVSIFEYDQELEVKKYRKAEYEHGRQDGYDAGMQEGIEAGRAAGIQEGRAVGIREGIETGRAAGVREGIETGRAAGIREGIETGRTAGIQEGRTAALRTIVRNLAKQNIPVQQIAEAAGVDEATVREWIEEKSEQGNK